MRDSTQTFFVGVVVILTLVGSPPLKSEIFLVLDDENFISLRERERCRLLFLFCCPCPLAIGASLLQTSVSVKVTAESALSLAVGELIGGGAVSYSDGKGIRR